MEGIGTTQANKDVIKALLEMIAKRIEERGETISAKDAADIVRESKDEL